MTPSGFWLNYSLDLFPSDRFGLLGPARWAKWIDLSNKGDNPLNAAMLRSVGRALRESKTPSLVYLAPANNRWRATSAPFLEAVGRVEQQLKRFTSDFAARNIVYQSENLNNVLSGLVFTDEVHVSDAGTLGSYLASQACRALKQSGQRTDCRPIAAGSTNG